MSQIADSANTRVFHSQESTAESRVFRAMIAIVPIAVVVALITAPWRVMTGLIVGGALSLLNFHWLRMSMTAVLNQSAPRVGVIRYILRYLMIAAVVAIAYKLQIISLSAMIAGLCSFVPAFFVEASRQSYYMIIGREERF